MNGNDSKTLNSSPDETAVNVQNSNKPDSVNYRRLPKASWRYTFSSLSNPGFLYLWVSMITMMAGMQMQMLARGYLIYDITGSASLLGIINAAHALPMLGLALFGGAILRDIAAGLTYIKQTQIVRILLIMGLATTLLAMPFRFLMPVFVVDVYNKGPESMGLLIAIMGGGSLVGSSFIASIGQWRRGMILIIGSFLSALALLLLAFLPFYFAAAAIMILLGLGDAGRRTINHSLVMEKNRCAISRSRNERVYDEFWPNAARSASCRNTNRYSRRAGGYRAAGPSSAYIYLRNFIHPKKPEERVLTTDDH